MRKSAYSGLKGNPGTARKKPTQTKRSPEPRAGRGQKIVGRGQVVVIDPNPKKQPAKPKTRVAPTKKNISATELKVRTSQAIQASLISPVTIVKNGQPIAVLISKELFERLISLEMSKIKKPFPFDCAKGDPLINKNCNQDEYFRALTDQEVDDFIEGKY